MHTLIIFRGNSGSGKSSAAKALQRKIGKNTLLISQDTVRREMLLVHDGQNNAAVPLLAALLNYGSIHCEYVILEGILDAEWYRPLFETAIALFEDRIFAYYYDVSFEETLRRHAAKEIASFGEAQMRRWWKEKDLIGIIPEKLWNEDVSLESAVDDVFRDIINGK